MNDNTPSVSIDELPEHDPDHGPMWLQFMVKAIGTKEKPGAADNPMIIDAAAFVGRTWPDMADYCKTYKHDSTPWCGLATAWAVTKARIRPPFRKGSDGKFLASAAWREWGFDVKTFERGAIACLEGHVALCYEQEGSTTYLVGGNQGDAITIMPVKTVSILAYRWPAPEDYRTTWNYQPEQLPDQEPPGQ